MIRTKDELRFYIEADRMMNRGVFHYSLMQKLTQLFMPDYIMMYLEAMRKTSYYSHQQGICNKIICIIHKKKFKNLGMKLGISIGADVFGYGLVIPHYGTIVVGGSNRIGNYAVLHTSTCITASDNVIGDGLYMSTGAKITSKVTLGNGVSIAANSVVNKDCGDNVLLAGMPAVEKRQSDIWYVRDGARFQDRVQKIEAKRRTLIAEH